MHRDNPVMQLIQIAIGFLQAIIMAVGAYFTWRAATSWRDESRHSQVADVGLKVLSQMHVCCSSITDARSPMQWHEIAYSSSVSRLITADNEGNARPLYYPAGYLNRKSYQFDALETSFGPARSYYSHELEDLLRDIVNIKDAVLTSSEFLTKRLLEKPTCDIETDKHYATIAFSGKDDAVAARISNIKIAIEKMILDKMNLN